MISGLKLYFLKFGNSYGELFLRINELSLIIFLEILFTTLYSPMNEIFGS